MTIHESNLQRPKTNVHAGEENPAKLDGWKLLLGGQGLEITL